jgi:hypothetical protein
MQSTSRQMLEEILNIRKSLAANFSTAEDGYTKKMFRFSADAEEQLRDVRDGILSAEKLLRDVQNYYCEGEEMARPMQSQDFFGIFRTFTSSYKVSSRSVNTSRWLMIVLSSGKSSSSSRSSSARTTSSSSCRPHSPGHWKIRKWRSYRSTPQQTSARRHTPNQARKATACTSHLASGGRYGFLRFPYSNGREWRRFRFRYSCHEDVGGY